MRLFDLAVDELKTATVLCTGYCYVRKQIEKTRSLERVSNVREKWGRALACFEGFANVA